MTADTWRPGASLETLRARAALLRALREFFHARGVTEVDTPLLSRHATVDRHIHSFAVPGEPPRFLATSPEFAMKRLLAAGSGPIYQLSHVFRAEEAGRHHNPEFMLLEWYRPGWAHHALMDEVEALVREAAGAPGPFRRLTYREAFVEAGAPDPFTADATVLRAQLVARGIGCDGVAADRDAWLDLWMGAVVGPTLGRQRACFIHDFPASQAALARVRPGEPPVAERFELFWHGVELANGFHELTDAAEQRRRFEADQAWRRGAGDAVPPYDAHLVAALEAGMPPGAGVALGVDRLLMLMLRQGELASVVPFGWDRA
ncbi:MAG TPA: EF-P lysine aminoacylase EpmA [Candidatus Binatia bacterium]|nr:EF-P lysine aminoacylase EpmA [Candidatus Binatia bacterium]